MLNFDQFREVPTVEKKSRPENSPSRVSSPLSPRPYAHCPLAPIPSDRGDSIYSILGISLVGNSDAILWPLSGPCHGHFFFFLLLKVTCPFLRTH